MARLKTELLVALGAASLSTLAAWGCGDDVSDSGRREDLGLPRRSGPDGGRGLYPVCGDAVLEDGEQCDDGNAASGDGCSASCQLEPGWKCSTLGAACIAAGCGDGLLAGDEDCDDGNTGEGDGCSPICVLEAGFKCPEPGKGCLATVCGDGKREGTEQCDDGNVRPYDGCSPSCAVEPRCTGGICTAICGDGVKFPGEACDDGNTRSGDGCSATCQLEPGFSCQVVTSGLPPSIDLPVIYRDFRGDPSAGDFEHLCCGATPGIVQAALAADNAPAFNPAYAGGAVTSQATFDQWYHDTPGVNAVVLDKLTLTKLPNDSYRFSSSAFFPLDGKGFGNYGASGHNYHFTSEVRSVFSYQGGEVLDFTGDDDVFVFVNGRLAVDLGGLHGAMNGSVTLSGAVATNLGLTIGGMYELAVFQAERHTTESNYRLTLTGFVKARTSCEPICGDGIKTKNEACDDGVNAGGYDKCAPGCVLGPRCGDGVVQAEEGEQCDDGNLVSADGCSNGCLTEPSN